MKINKKEIVIFIIVFIISLFMCYNYITVHYANDTYAIYNMGYSEYATKIFLIAGRPFSCLLLLIADKLTISIERMVIISTVIGIIISCLSIMLIRKIIKNIKPVNKLYDEIIITIIAFATIYNFMYIEILHFFEACILSFGIFMSILGAYTLVFSKKYRIIKSFILLLFAVFSYNGTVCVYIVSAILLLLLKNNDFKKILKYIIIASCLIILSIALNFLQIKFATDFLNVLQNRLSSNIVYNIIYILINIRRCIIR